MFATGLSGSWTIFPSPSLNDRPLMPCHSRPAAIRCTSSSSVSSPCASHDCVYEGLSQRLLRREAGVPSAKHNRKVRAQFLNRFRDANCRSNMWPGQHRDPEAKRIRGFAKNRLFVIGSDQIVDEFDIESGLKKRRGEAEQRQRCAQRRPLIRRVKQHDFVRSGQTLRFRDFGYCTLGCQGPLICQRIVKFVSLRGCVRWL